MNLTQKLNEAEARVAKLNAELVVLTTRLNTVLEVREELAKALGSILPLTEGTVRLARQEAERAKRICRGSSSDIIAGNEYRHVLQVIKVARALLPSSDPEQDGEV
jgi:predicted dinucleotide-binding enzyme